MFENVFKSATATTVQQEPVVQPRKMSKVKHVGRAIRLFWRKVLRKKDPVLQEPVVNSPVEERRRGEEHCPVWSALSSLGTNAIKSKAPGEILHLFGHHLTSYQEKELSAMTQIWYFGLHNKAQGPSNHGYDNSGGCYSVVPHDHLHFRYEVLERIGSDGQSQVIKCLDHKTNTLVAVKMLVATSRDGNAYRQEMEVLMTLRLFQKADDKDCMVRILDSFSFRGHYCIVMELLNESIKDVITKSGPRGIDQEMVKTYTRGILSFLCHSEQMNIIHGDIKPSNIMVKDGVAGTIKVIDFSLSCHLQNQPKVVEGTPLFMSPEALLGHTLTCATDMWSLGCTVGNLAFGTEFFDHMFNNDHSLCCMEAQQNPPQNCIKDGPKRVFCFRRWQEQLCLKENTVQGAQPIHQVLQQQDKDLLDFISCCLHWDPSHRMTPAQALGHRFLQRVVVANPTKKKRRCKEEEPVVQEEAHIIDSPGEEGRRGGEHYVLSSTLSSSCTSSRKMKSPDVLREEAPVVQEEEPVVQEEAQIMDSPGEEGRRGEHCLPSSTLSSSGPISRQSKSPDEFLVRFFHRLTPYQKQELEAMKEIWYFGLHNKARGALNHGYDSSGGFYIFVRHDHLHFRYEVLERIGLGSQCEVFMCLDHKTNTLVAVKMLVVTSSDEKAGRQQIELVMMRQLSRKADDKDCIVRILDCFTFRGHKCIVMELLKESLKDVIKKSGPRGIVREMVKTYTRGILSFLCHSEQMNIIHGDIKPSNIMVKDCVAGTIKVINFSFSCHQQNQPEVVEGTPLFMSPEALLGYTLTCATDMWSLGCTVGNLVFGTKFFDHMYYNEHRLSCMEAQKHRPLNCIKNGPKRLLYFCRLLEQLGLNENKVQEAQLIDRELQQQDKDVVHFISSCLHWDPSHRMTPAQALEHRWLQGPVVQELVSPVVQ